ncbi:MAG: serine hydrolase domain-containing protein [bacterium]
MNRNQQIQRVADQYTAAQKYSGIQWQVEAGGECLSRGASGFADAALRTPIPEQAIYRIYSMTKPIVSVLALMLMERGKLRLYDMLPQFDRRFAQMRVLTTNGDIVPALRPITVEDLLTHRSGLTYEFIHGCHVAQYYREAEIIGDSSRTLEEMVGAIAMQPLAFQPGSQWRYGVSTDVLAYVCQVAGGKPLAELLEEFIFSPLGMRDTAFAVPAEQLHRLMPMYGVGDLRALPALDITPQTLEPMDITDMHPTDQGQTFQRGGHGLYSTLADYLAFARMLLDGCDAEGTPLLSRTTHAMLQVNRLPAEQVPIKIGPGALPGYGWGLIGRVMLDQGQAVTLTGNGEFGWAGAASTHFWVDTKEQMVGVVMTQYLGATLPLADDMRTAAYQSLV